MPWYRGIAPAYLTLFIWAPFFDQLWAADLPRFGVWSLVAFALAGSLLCFGLYFAAASWGWKTRRPLVVLAASTFGAAGSEWLCGIGIAAAGVIWYAVAINFAVDSTLLGLRACGMITANTLAPWASWPIEIKSPVFLGTALFWVYITRQAIRLRLPGVVVALMKVYSPIAVLLLFATAVWRLPLLWSPSTRRAAAFAQAPGPHAAAPAFSPGALPMMIGFFALSGLLSADWGAAVKTRRDVVLAGLSGVLATCIASSILSLVVVLETTTWLGAGGNSLSADRPEAMPFSFRWAVFEGRETFPRGAAAAILILFGLETLALAVSSLNKVAEGISTHWPGLTPRGNTVIACLVAVGLVATYQVDRLGPVYTAMGAIFAPMLGAMAGDRWGRTQRGVPLRTRINPAGLLAWATGCAVACASAAVTVLEPASSAWLEQGSIYGLLVSACVYRLLAGVGLLSTAVPKSGSKIER